MTDDPMLSGPGFVLRPVTVQAFPDLLQVLADPTVARWWGNYDAARVAEEYGGPDADAAFVIDVEGEAAGFIQYGEEIDPWYRHASIDIALREQHQARGLGPAAIRVLARYLFEVKGHHRLTIDPAAENENAIRAYERVGFRRVGVMRQYERGPAGVWRDGLLMDLLRDELLV